MSWVLAKIRLKIFNQRPNSAASSSVTSAIFSWCSRVVTNKCPGERGMISRKARTRGELRTGNAAGETSDESESWLAGHEYGYAVEMAQNAQEAHGFEGIVRFVVRC